MSSCSGPILSPLRVGLNAACGTTGVVQLMLRQPPLFAIGHPHQRQQVLNIAPKVIKACRGLGSRQCYLETGHSYKPPTFRTPHDNQPQRRCIAQYCTSLLKLCNRIILHFVMDSIVFYQPPSTRSTPPRGESVGSGNACTSKSASETSQRNEFKDILSNVLNDRDLIEVRDITALDLGESDLPLHHASKDDGNSCANCEDNDNDQDFPSVEEILWREISNNGSPSPKRTPKRLDKEIWTGDSQGKHCQPTQYGVFLIASR